MWRSEGRGIMTRRHLRSERGMALITTLLVMMLMSALLVGFTAVVMSDQRYRFIDRDRNQAFYAASAGIEKMTADLGNLFLASVAPTATQITALTVANKRPAIDDVTFTAVMDASTLPTSSLTKCVSPNTIAMTGTAGYTIHFCAAANGNPTTSSSTPIKSGPYEGLVAQQMPYQLDVTAKTKSGGDVHLVRTMEAVAIPVFQFGIFSDVDLSFFAGPNFNFGGRVHSNGSLFLSEGNGATLTLSDKVTAVKEIVRQQMQNGVSIDTGPSPHLGTINVAQSPNVYRSLLRTEGSVTDGIGSAENEPKWHTTSLSTYNSWIRNGRTGAKTLNLALITVGGTNPDLIRRPPVGEDTTNAVLFGERLFQKASLRILLSDKPEDITSLPTVSAGAPVSLEPADWPPTGYSGVPLARSPGPQSAAITTGSSYSSSTHLATIKTTTISAYFRIPSSITVAGTTSTSTTVACTKRTATTLEGCSNVPKYSAGAIVTLSVPSGAGTIIVTAPTANSNSTAGNNKTLQFASTASFAPTTFWVNTTANPPLSTLVTCPGYDTTTSPQQFTSCAGLSAAPSSGQTMTTGAKSNAGTGTLGGVIKIERQAGDGSWNDVTLEILKFGIGGPSASGAGCSDPSSNAIVRLERLRDSAADSCTASSANANDYWPNTLFDSREATQRDTDAGSLKLGGVMHYVAIDVANLAQWFRGTGAYAGISTGTDSKLDNGGYTVYFSDRRNNRNASNAETGDYGWEDFVNPNSSTGAPNNSLDAGEDVNGNGVLDVYGGIPSYNGASGQVPPCATPCAPAPLNASARPTTSVSRADAQVNRAILFRRALKLVHGRDIRPSYGITGLTIVAENPVYVLGDWNTANGGSSNFDGTHAATSVMADAVTLLSNNWNDDTSFSDPYAPGNRDREEETWYRLAIISGKGQSFSQPAGTATDFGTDGGAHNFLRYLEDGDQPVNYRGSMATFFYNRQAVGTFKCCATVYVAPTRKYAFDIDFLDPALLPPNTPMFRDLNTVGFAQEMRPGR
jgi:Tfp pilus assembly protein PilX